MTATGILLLAVLFVMFVSSPSASPIFSLLLTRNQFEQWQTHIDIMDRIRRLGSVQNDEIMVERVFQELGKDHPDMADQATSSSPASFVYQRLNHSVASLSLPSVTANGTGSISAVIMNHGRPWILLHSSLLFVLLHHPAVSQIRICHSNPSTTFDNARIIDALQRRHGSVSAVLSKLIRTKVHHVNAVEADARMGLALRFHYAAAKVGGSDAPQWTLIVDDDVEFAGGAIDRLLLEASKATVRVGGHDGYTHFPIVGRYGRQFSLERARQRNGYDTTNVYGNSVEVVLTKIMLLPTHLCREFFVYASLVLEDVVLPATTRSNASSGGTNPPHRAFAPPFWNGEDIFLNLVANYVNTIVATSKVAANEAGRAGSETSKNSEGLGTFLDPSFVTMTNHGLRRSHEQGGGEDQVGTFPDTLAPTWVLRGTAIRDLPVWESALASNAEIQLEWDQLQAKQSHQLQERATASVSGNIDQLRPWQSGFLLKYWETSMKANQHAAYRGILWSTAKRRLSKLRQRLLKSK
jgi:hypothetical protein